MSEADLSDMDLPGFKNLAGLESRPGSFSAATFDPVPFLILPLFEKLGPAQGTLAFVGVFMRVAVRIMLKVAFVSVVAAQAADGLPEGFQVFEHQSRTQFSISWLGQCGASDSGSAGLPDKCR